MSEATIVKEGTDIIYESQNKCTYESGIGLIEICQGKGNFTVVEYGSKAISRETTISDIELF